MKKLFSLLLVCALAFTMSVSAFAAEAAPSTEKEPPAQTEVDATTRAADIPTESVALPYYATVVNLCEGCGTYTRYYLNTTSGKLTIGGTLNSSGDENNSFPVKKMSPHICSITVIHRIMDKFLRQKILAVPCLQG